MMSVKYKAIDIAEYFVKKGKEENIDITQMKLQKLCYIAHGRYLAKQNKPLINEPVFAWRFGPVYPSIYQKYRLHGSNPIKVTYFDQWPWDGAQQISEDDKNLLLETWNKYKSLSAIQLSSMTHRKGTPWSRYYEAFTKDIVIPDSDIKDHYVELLRG